MDLIRQNYDSSDDEENGCGSTESSQASVDASDSASEQSIVYTDSYNIPVPDIVHSKYHIAPSIQKRRRTTEQSNKNTSISLSLSEMKSPDCVSRFFTVGQWTSFVYFEWRPSSRDRLLLNRCINECNKLMKPLGLRFNPLYMTELGSPLPLHVSLSPNMRFKKQGERDLLYTRVVNELKISQMLRPFDLEFEPVLEVMGPSSFHRDVRFLVFKISKKQRETQIRELFDILNRCLVGIEGYQDKFTFFRPEMAHLSIGRLVMPEELTNALQLHTGSGALTKKLASLRTETPRIAVNSIRFDRNRESLPIMFS